MLLDEYGFPIQRYHYDADGDKATIQTVQDVEPYLEANKKFFNDPVKDDPVFGRRVASIPPIFAEKWLNEDGVNFLALRGKELRAYLRRKLSDPQYLFLRTHPGKY